MNKLELSYLADSVDAHIAMLNKVQSFNTYDKDGEGFIYERCNQSGMFHSYDGWTFLERSAEVITRLARLDKLNKAFE